MPLIEDLNILLGVAVVAALLSLYYLFSLLVKLAQKRFLPAFSRLLKLAVFASLTAAISLLFIGTQGYQTLSLEEPVARLEIQPQGDQIFEVTMTYKDLSEQRFTLKGDELLIDAYILKWAPWANLLGLHTAYRLDRISGRYKDLAQESSESRSVFAIADNGELDIASWRQEYSSLSLLLDLEHGSASFVSADQPAQYQLMVTTSGLLLRPIASEVSD